ncbi:MAG TPA: TonB-dependent receptor [Caulobacteraceae bacterium]|nr:TonB-dependent receptor [Caulobacteraceae bacterium]
MIIDNRRVRRMAFATSSILALAISSGFAGKAEAAAAAAPTDVPEVAQVEVTAPPTAVTAVAPVRASLAETEPQAIITRKFIEEGAPRVGDFTTIATFAPSMVARPNPNGPGLSDGGKVTMRGFADGQYNVTYDGIPWNDTNGPSHHGTAFFPSSTIGGIIVDRGPGNATDLGQANFGGSVNLLSLPLEQVASVTAIATAGSWSTYQGVVTLQSGKLDDAHDAHLLANFQALGTNGYLTYNRAWSNNEMIKGDIALTENWKLTGLFEHSTGFYNKSDIGDASVAQMEANGRNFALSNNRLLENYYGYNWVHKDTDFAYLRLEGDLGHGWRLNETIYDFDYSNNTESGANNLATTSADLVTLTPGTTYPAPGKGYSSTLQTAGVPAYYKKNQYIVSGDVTKFAEDTDYGTFTAGVLYEVAKSNRHIWDIDALTGLPDYREKSATTPGPSGVYVNTPLNISYTEFSGWHQYQPFAQFVWKATDRLTITPGVKYVHFDLYVNAPVEKLSVGPQPLYTDQVFTKTLPFLTANYKITDSWSTYGQYAQGFLVPNIGNLYVANVSTKIVPQESTNYQLGTVYNHGNLSLDADVYYIDFKHKIQSFIDGTTGQSYDTNSGGAYYQGVEFDADYAVTREFSVYGNWSRNEAVGKDDPSNPLYNGHQLTGVSSWTAALGARFSRDHVFTEDDTLTAVLINKWVGPLYVNNATCSSAPNGVCAANAVLTPVSGLLKTNSEANLTLTYRLGRYSIEGQILNLLDQRSVIVAKGKAYIPGTSYFAQSSALGGGANALEYQVPRNFEITLRARF